MKDTALGNLRVGTRTEIALPSPTGPLKRYLDPAIADLWMAVTWSA